MTERRMIPDVDELSPMERSGLVHEESSQAASDLATRAYADRRNVIWYITMSKMESTLKRTTDLREAGYTEIVGVFVDIPAWRQANHNPMNSGQLRTSAEQVVAARRVAPALTH